MSFVGVDEVINSLADPDSFRPWSAADLGLPDAHYPDQAYAGELAAAAQKAGSEESVVVGAATVDGNPVAFILGNFDFLAGSVGRRACQLVIAALQRAAAENLPVFASPSSGGTRMQEGTPAFVLMVDVANAVREFRASGQPMIVWLRNPTTGGVMATWGSLGTVTFAQPRSLTGFLGPRVYETLEGKPFPPGIQTGEHLAEVGIIDKVVGLEDLCSAVAPLFGLSAAKQDPELRMPAFTPVPVTDAWANIERTRDPKRPSARDVVSVNLTGSVELSGTTTGESSPAITLHIGRWHGTPVVVVAQDRLAQAAGHGITGASLRVARRGIALANELRLPIVSIIETAGAELSAAAEESALAGEIARCLADLSGAMVPTVSVVLGMGCGGGALAMLPADVVLAAESAWISPLPLEGASVIRYRTADRAPEMATLQQVTADKLWANGIADYVIPERVAAAGDVSASALADDAQRPGVESAGSVFDSAALVANVGVAVGVSLRDLATGQPQERQAKRRSRYNGGLDG